MYGVGFGYGAIGATTKRSGGGLIYPLDAYGGAVAAYSLRKLSSTYTGNCIRVRRSSDNTEQDIGFVDNVLDSTSLLTFCGSGNGFVTTWYDQSGTGRNNTQTTASLQPQIVVSGVVNKLNNKPSILWSDTSDKIMGNNSAITATSLTIAAVYSSKSYSFTKLLSIGSDQPGSGVAYMTFSGGDQYDFKLNDFVFFGNGYNLGAPRIVSFGKLHPDNLQTYGFLNSNSGSSNMYINGSEISYRVQQTGNINVGNGFLRLGNSDIYPQQLRGNMQEIIIYASNQSSNRAGINTNINTFYGIY